MGQTEHVTDATQIPMSRRQLLLSLKMTPFAKEEKKKKKKKKSTKSFHFPSLVKFPSIQRT